METYKGMFISAHKVIDRASKTKAENSLHNWEIGEFTAEEWMQKLDQGQTINPSIFEPKQDGTYTHAMTEQITKVNAEKKVTETRQLWQSTHFMCCDGDNLKNVEFDEDSGKDKNPDGLEPWTEAGLLSRKLPKLLDKVYAVGESVSSMLKEPLHRRFRIVFLFDQPFTDEDHYRQVFSQLAEEFPIISNVKRAPSQPVFGNGREGFDFFIQGNILKLDDYPKVEETQQQTTSHTQNFVPSETLEEFLRRHGIAYTLGKHNGKYFVDCPFKKGHTDGKQGKTDSYVFDDGSGWAFYCSHAHCANKRTWSSFKDGMGIQNGNGNSNSRNYSCQPPDASQEPPSEDQIERSDEETMAVEFPQEMFYGLFQTYRQSLEDRTPVPDAFAFATVKHAISASLGRRIHLESQIPVFPNVFTGLIGESSTGHKGVSINVIRQLLQTADPNVLILTKTATEEGLIDMFRTPEMKTGTDDDGNEYSYYTGGIADLLPDDRVEEMVGNIDSHESIRIMGSFEELSAILNRSKKVTFSGMTELLMELYDMPKEILVGNKIQKSSADYPTFSMIGASAFELIEQSLAHYFITGGFTNRIEWYIGEEKEPIFLYKMADTDLWTECVEEIKKIRDSYVQGQSFTISQEAYTLGDKWNKEFTEHHKSIDNILVAGSMKRMKIFVIKNALIFAALEHRGNHEIQIEDMINAIKLSEYNCTVVEKLFGNFANTEHQRVCNRIIEILKKTPMLSARQMLNQMKWADPKEVDLALDVLTKHGYIGRNEPKRTVLYFVKKDEME